MHQNRLLLVARSTRRIIPVPVTAHLRSCFKHAAYPRLGVLEAWRADLADRAGDVVRGPEAPVVHGEDRLIWQAPGFDRPLVIAVPDLFEGVEEEW